LGHTTRGRSRTMGELGTQNLEKLKGTHLEKDAQEELLTTQTECSFVFLNKEGWPTGVVMSFIWLDGRFWLTAVEGRAHVKGADADERVTVIVSSAGSGLPGRRMVASRGRVTVHRDRETIDWFLHEFTHRIQPEGADEWRKLLDSPNRVVFEVTPEAKPVSHDQRKIPGNGRGLAQDPERTTPQEG
jgi:general stress protein 26